MRSSKKCRLFVKFVRIAYLTPTFPPYPGGIGINAYYNALEMAKRGFDVEVFTPKYPRESLSELEIKNKQIRISSNSFKISSVISEPKIHYLYPFFSYGNAAFLPQLFWRLRQFDIVHCYYPFFGGAEMAALTRKFFQFKLVIHHEMDTVGEGWMKKFFSWHTRRILPWILKNSDLLLALSEDYFHHSDIGRLYEKSRQLPPWEVVPNGVNTDLFQYQIPDTKYQIPIIVFAAGLDRAHYFKGVLVLLEAMALLQKQSFPVKLRLAGEGELKNDYQKQAQKLGIVDLVEFVGLITHDKLPEFYSCGDLFVMPSIGRTESFSLATAEAQACGLPAVVSDLPGMRMTIQNGETGLLVKPGDSEDLAQKIKIILANPEMARQMGQAGRQRMEKYFSWKMVGDKLEKIYQQLTQNSNVKTLLQGRIRLRRKNRNSKP